MLGVANCKCSEIETNDEASFSFGVVVGVIVYENVLVGGFTEHAKITGMLVYRYLHPKTT